MAILTRRGRILPPNREGIEMSNWVDRSRGRVAAALLLVAVVVLPASRAVAAVPTAGNILVSSNSTLIEYTPAGALVQSVPIPSGGGDGGSRDLVLDRNGNVQIYNGTFNPILSQFNPAAG